MPGGKPASGNLSGCVLVKLRRIYTRFALVALLAAGTGLRAADDKVEGDLKKIQGKWTAPAGEGGKVTYTFTGRNLKVEAPSRTYQMTVTLDPSARPEKSIDFKIDEAPDDAEGKTAVNTALQKMFTDGSWKKALETNVGPSGYTIPSPPTIAAN